MLPPSDGVTAALGALGEAIAGGEAVLAAQGVDLAALETQVLGGVVDPADVAAQAGVAAPAGRRAHA